MPVAPPRALLAVDDRDAFDCGRDSLNAWFKRHAWNNHVDGASRVSVMTDIETGKIVGYVTLSAAQIERSFLPRPLQRNRPDPVPATLLGQLAVDVAYQGQGHAKSLLLFAIKTALRAAEMIGTTGVITHPLDDGVRGFYAAYGFTNLPFDPRRAMMARMVELERAFSGSRDRP